MKKLNIAVVTSSTGSKYTQLFIKAIKDRGHNPVIIDVNTTYLLVSSSVNGYDRIYLADGDEPQRLLAKELDAFITRIGANTDFGCAVVKHLYENLGIFGVQTAEGIQIAANKWSTTQILSTRGVKNPITVFAHKPKHVKFLLDKCGGLPAIAKTIKGSLGSGVALLETPLAANSALGAMYHSDMQLVLQSYIDTSAKGYRAIVLGEKVIASMLKEGDKKEFRDNLAKGAKGSKVELSKEDQSLAVAASQAIGLKFSGVDLLKDPSGMSYVVEVNSNPGMSIVDVTGINVPGLVVEYIEKNYASGNPKTDRQLLQSYNGDLLMSLDKCKDVNYQKFITTLIQSKCKF